MAIAQGVSYKAPTKYQTSVSIETSTQKAVLPSQPPPIQWTLFTEGVSTSSLPRYGYQLRSNSVINNMSFSQEGVLGVGQFVFTDDARFHSSGHINP